MLVSGVFVFLLLWLGEAGASYSPGADKLCLSCQNVIVPNSCAGFVEVRPDEACVTERVVLDDGTLAWTFGYQEKSLCSSDAPGAPADVTTIISDIGTFECQECCDTDLCNHKLCDSLSQNNLACLAGEDARGQSVPSVTYCKQGDSCHAELSSSSRPGQFHYGCASQEMCNQIVADDNTDTSCQMCCETDGCNVQGCNGQEETQQDTCSVTCKRVFADCWDLYSCGGFRDDGVYEIYPDPEGPGISVRCDMTTNGGGWTVFQRRYDGSLSFEGRIMDDYANGFGQLDGEFWLSLDTLHQMTTHGTPMKLRVDMCGAFTPNRNRAYAEFDNFSLGERKIYHNSYILNYGYYSYQGNAYDNLRQAIGYGFSVTGSCAQSNGALWYGVNCGLSGFNGVDIATGIYWGWYRDSAEMKFRPLSVIGDTPEEYTCRVLPSLNNRTGHTVRIRNKFGIL